MHIDCATCTARGPGCGDCVVTVLLGLPAPALPRPREVSGTRVRWTGFQADGSALPAGLTAEDERALAVLAGAGLVPGLARTLSHRHAG